MCTVPSKTVEEPVSIAQADMLLIASEHAPATRSAEAILLRATGAVLGGYVLSAAVVALMVVLFMLAGLIRSESVVLSSMLGFVFYVGVLIWAFSVRSLACLWAVLTVGTTCCALAAWPLVRP